MAAAILLGPTRAHIIAIALIGKLHSLGYSRDAESKADVTGSDICATAGYNPWGLTWLFQDFQNADVGQIPQLLSDHPANGTRMRTLEKHFRDNPPRSQSSAPTPNLRLHSACQKTRLWFCALTPRGRISVLKQPQAPSIRSAPVLVAAVQLCFPPLPSLTCDSA